MDTTRELPALERDDFSPEALAWRSDDRLFAAYLIVDPNLTYAAEQAAAFSVAINRLEAVAARLHNAELDGAITAVANLAPDWAAASLDIGLHAGAVLGPLVAASCRN